MVSRLGDILDGAAKGNKPDEEQELTPAQKWLRGLDEQVPDDVALVSFTKDGLGLHLPSKVPEGPLGPHTIFALTWFAGITEDQEFKEREATEVAKYGKKMAERKAPLLLMMKMAVAISSAPDASPEVKAKVEELKAKMRDKGVDLDKML